MATRILMLNALTDQSGSGVRFWSIAKELARMGHTICFLERSIDQKNRESDNGVQYRSNHETGVLWLDVLRAMWFNTFHGLIFRPDYVFALKPLPNTCLPAIFLRQLYHCRTILDIDDLDYAYYPDRLRQAVIGRFFKGFPPFFDLVTTHNEPLRLALIEEVGTPPERIYFLPQGIETKRFIQAQPNQSYQSEWGIGPRDRLLVYSASLGITSDFDSVLPMLVGFLRGRDDTKVLVVGDGRRKDVFAREVAANGLEGRIIFTDNGGQFIVSFCFYLLSMIR